MKNFEKALPAGYKEAFHIDARNAKTGLIFNLVAFLPVIAMIVVFFLTLDEYPLITNTGNAFNDMLVSLLRMLGILVALVAYMVLHELVHGIAYKALTGEKLTFGLSWSCAFCGVPNVYVYRKTAIIALMAPFVVFTLLFLPLTVIGYFTSGYLYVLFGILLSMHLGGCSGDLYMFLLLTFRFKDESLLMRDTGPEQWLYIK